MKTTTTELAAQLDLQASTFRTIFDNEEAAVLLEDSAQRLRSLEAMDERNRKLFGRCLEVISTLEGECSTEEELLSALKADIKTSMGVAPLIKNGLI